MDDVTPRWMYRFENYRRALGLLREAVDLHRERELTQLEKEGCARRFEYTWELAWKLLKDYLEGSEFVLPVITPASVVKAAFAAKIVRDGDAWMRALDACNKMLHTYNFKDFARTVDAVRDEYIAIFDELCEYLLNRAP